jgi:hypothetical protein
VAIYTGTATNTVNQYAKVVFTSDLGEYPYIYFRYSAGGSPLYGIQMYQDGTVGWYRSATATSWSGTQIGSTLDVGSIGQGQSIGVTVIGTGASTVVRVWLDPVGNAPDAGGETWNSAAPTVSWTDDPATAVDTGNYVGIGGAQGTANYLRYESFFGGDVP